MLYILKFLWVPKVVLPFSIAVIAICGDTIVSFPHLGPLQRAFVDNLTHALIGVNTWYCVCVCCFSQYKLAHEFVESLLCGILSSVIDVDHFIAAKSFHLSDAVNLESRPFLHCTTLLLAGCTAVLLAGRALGVPSLQRACWLAAAAVLSHHVRDATRRGLFLWPFGSTRPVPYPLYVCLSMLLPFAIAAFVSVTHLQKLPYVAVWEV